MADLSFFMDKLRVFFKYISTNKILISVLIFILAIAAFLRFYQIDKLSFWSDELLSVQVAYSTFFSQIWFRNPHMILFNLILSFWVRIFPTTFQEMLRTLPAIFSLLSIPVMFMLGKVMLKDKKEGSIIGLMAAFFVAINSFHIQYAQELRSYSLVFLLTLLSTLFLIKAIEKPKSKIRWLVYSVLIIASFYSHLFSVFILIAHMVSLLILLKNKEFGFPYKYVIASFMSIIVALAPLLLVSYVKRNMQIPWIPELTFNLFLSFLVVLAGNQGMLLLIWYAVLVIAGLFFGFKLLNQQKTFLIKWKIILIVNCLFLPILFTIFISIFRPIFWPRYLLFVMPYLAIIAAMGVFSMMSLKSWKNRNFIAIVALVVFVLLSSIGIKNYFLNYNKEDFRGVAKLISKRCVNSLRVYYPFWINNAFTYYNPSSKSQIAWSSDLGEQYSFKEITSRISNKYNSACLIISVAHLNTAPKNQNLSEVQSFLFKKFSNRYEINYYQFIVYIYSKY
jgi:uncharacterized membrane protein